jgi:hypothetical protein
VLFVRSGGEFWKNRPGGKRHRKDYSERLQGAKPATAHGGNSAKRAPSGEGNAATLPHCRPSRATLALDV